MNMNTLVLSQNGLSREEWMLSSWRHASSIASDSKTLITIIVPAKRHASTTPLRYLVSESGLKKLIKGQSIHVGEVQIRLISPSSNNSHTHKQVLLVVSAREDQIPKIHKIQNVIARVVMPCLAQDEIAWKQLNG